MLHTNWDNLMMKWSGCQRWWEVPNDWKSFVKTAEGLCKRTQERDEDTKKRGFSLIEAEKFQNEAEEERQKNKMKERKKLRIWDPAWRNQMRIQILGDRNQYCELDEWKMEDQQSKVQSEGTEDTAHDGQN